MYELFKIGLSCAVRDSLGSCGAESKSMLYGKVNAYRSIPEVQEQEEVITREYELLLYDTLVPNLLSQIGH